MAWRDDITSEDVTWRNASAEVISHANTPILVVGSRVVEFTSTPGLPQTLCEFFLSFDFKHFACLWCNWISHFLNIFFFLLLTNKSELYYASLYPSGFVRISGAGTQTPGSKIIEPGQWNGTFGAWTEREQLGWKKSKALIFRLLPLQGCLDLMSGEPKGSTKFTIICIKYLPAIEDIHKSHVIGVYSATDYLLSVYLFNLLYWLLRLATHLSSSDSPWHIYTVFWHLVGHSLSQWTVT